ncbi:AAA family ATPase [Synechococcus sp. N19]|uniref:AAA family ATPase n=1 Tax=Synechococcus sp. N19 TaxID=2575512 RepID=UPI000E0F6272|nr:AAA family ATPase [Synechococcus sp. N19]
MEVNYQELFRQQQEGIDIGLEPVETTFTDMVRATLNAILKQDRDAEMQCRSDLKADYKISDGQITRELFKAFTATEVAVAKKTSDSVDLSKVEQLGYLKDGWIPSSDVSLVYGPFGTGKTSLALGLALAAAKGEPFLDRTTPGERLRTLVICTDSGVGPLKKSLDDLGVDPDDPLLKPDHPDQMIWVWGQAADQGHQSWCADINGVVHLREFVQQNNIAWTVIDSAKSVSSAAGWSYSDNDAVRELLRYMREGICQPLKHSICLLSHDGTGNGTHAGAKSWAEDPSMVISLARAVDPEGRSAGVTAEFKKDRAATVDPHRKLTFSLDRENGGFLLSPECDVVGTCLEAITDVLYKAHQNGRNSLSRQSLGDEVYTAHGYAQKTVDNTVGAMVAKREIIKPARGRVALAPSTLQRLTSNRDLSLEGSNKARRQSHPEVLPVPETVPAAFNGKNCSSQGTSTGIPETPVIAIDQM